ENNYTISTFTTWQITIKKILEDKSYGECALLMMNVIAYLSSSGIKRDWFFCLIQDKRIRIRSVRLLVKYCILDASARQEILSVHSLFQEMVRIQLRADGGDVDMI